MTWYLPVKPVIARTRALPGWPRLYRTVHQEVETPFRGARRALVVRLTGRRALVLAVLRHRGVADEDQALAELGMHGHGAWTASECEESVF